MNELKSISIDGIEEVLHCTVGHNVRANFRDIALRYEELNTKELENYILEVLDVLMGESMPVAGATRLPAWENGWGENLKAFKETANAEALVPRYHGKHRLLHWKQCIIRPVVPQFDYHINCLLVDWVVDTYLSKVSELYEFGCGPAYHLIRARRYNTGAKLIGLDWTTVSQEIISAIVSSGLETRIEGHRFDFCAPDGHLHFGPNAGIFTVAALEQIGDSFEPFLEFLLQQRPVVCVHLEPIDELMDNTNLIDRLSVLYCRKRNYLKGFLTRLRHLRDLGKVEILREQRTYTGSFFIEGHSLVVWRPV